MKINELKEREERKKENKRREDREKEKKRREFSHLVWNNNSQSPFLLLSLSLSSFFKQIKIKMKTFLLIGFLACCLISINAQNRLPAFEMNQRLRQRKKFSLLVCARVSESDRIDGRWKSRLHDLRQGMPRRGKPFVRVYNVDHSVQALPPAMIGRPPGLDGLKISCWIRWATPVPYTNCIVRRSDIFLIGLGIPFPDGWSPYSMNAAWPESLYVIQTPGKSLLTFQPL